MVDGEATQEPNAPEDAPASPPVEPPAVETPEPVVEAAAQNLTESPIEAASAEPEGTVVEPGLAADWSHVQGFQAVEPAAESLASRADYAEELVKELDARAARFAQSVDESIVLSSDGAMRWLGDPVARIVAGEQWLQPRAVLLADEALAGEARTSVETRLALWLAAHVRKLLGPLLALEQGAEMTEAAKPLAARVAEALGVLDRERVRNEVRGLDQTARGALRKLGVRFGSLYIYVPALLKPAARSLCVLLWTLRRGPETGADRLLAFASAGRTSFANEGLLSPDAYRVAGFRLCGERVVRVDIIERLSDLIRAALPDHMRGGSRPTSEAYGFAVTPQMTSLTGCSGDAFASILRSLNFEPLKVAKSAFEASRVRAATEPVQPVLTPEATTTDVVEFAPEAVSVAEDANGAEAALVEAKEPEAPTLADPLVADPESAVMESAAELAPEALVPEEAPADEPAAANESETLDAASELSAESEGDALAAEEEASPAVEAAPETAEGAAEEIEIWRPAPRRPRAPPRPPSAEARSPRGKPHRRPEQVREEAPAESRPAAAEEAPRPERRDEKPRRFEGKGDVRDERRPQKTFPPRRESRPVDPDSPFAKLAALKPLLERRDKRP